MPEKEPLFILSDFNARVSADHSSWTTCLGQFGTGKMKENGQRLLELCCHYGLCVSNPFFNTEPHHRVSLRHPRSKHWHQLDLPAPAFPAPRSHAAIWMLDLPQVVLFICANRVTDERRSREARKLTLRKSVRMRHRC